MRSLVVSACVLCALSCSCLVFPVSANPVPDPMYCTVTGTISPDGVFIAPGPVSGTSLTITVRSPYNMPMPYAQVTIGFDPRIRVCADAQHTRQAGSDGVCTIQLRGGGCVRNTDFACVVKANGIEIRHYRNVKSPDNGAHTQSQADGTVSTVDLAFFGDEFRGVAAVACHDYDNDNDCDTVDLGYFGDPFHAGLVCTLR